MQKIVIVGAGGFACEVLDIVMAQNAISPQYEFVGFIDENRAHWGMVLNGHPVLGGFEWFETQDKAQIQVTCAVGNPAVRQELVEKASALGLRFCTITHPTAVLTPFVKLGEGVIITAGCILTNRIKVGNHVHLNLDCTIGHDAIMDDFATLAPGVHVSGWVFLRKRVYVGTGAVIINGTQEEPVIIGDDAVIGAGACVIGSVSEGLTVVGVPAKPLPRS